MERNIKIAAITLKKIKLGESNLGLTLLTEDDQILFVAAFGASKVKSKLFEGTAPFTNGLWDLYYDPVKEHWRAKDFTLIDNNSGMENSIEIYYTATLLLEIVLKTPGAEGVFPILKQAITSLRHGEHREEVLMQFILRVLKEQGLLPPFRECTHCGRDVFKETLYFTGREELYCDRCVSGPKIATLNPGIRAYCHQTPDMEWEESIGMTLSELSLKECKNFLLELIKLFTGGKLLTLNSANGLI